MNQLINITQNENNDSVVSGRELHDFLEVSERYSTWFERMVKYGFEENVDFVGCKVFNTLAKQELQDHALKLDMAKEISMIQRTAKGKEARQYFIQVEKEYKQQQQVPLTLDQQIAAIATGYGSVKEELVEVKDQVADLTNRFGLPSNKAKVLQKKVATKVYMFTGGKASNAHKKIGSKVFREFYKDLNNRFDVVKYSDIPLSRYEEALEYLEMWQPAFNTTLEIRSLNSQTSFEFEPA
ncbi:ORF6C domain-containing protein [Lactococcus formosensis]|uniref:ORF6C domain-containing protein n=1 Tax=Lactococcus formosensis TaxID=1281486 RepID=A0A9X4SNS6_9LACT|nr:ORF6C domain-containing protein [Lactococcus formosensis]MDG6142876.1 ORF6C domain-containing protein [Lactococcus formosensis]MDG6161031.1 ORF6C domain-containing protein [Lactococcus formosensis]MDG6193802.1 ORF6C domain-containing protein [Lactococcus formosensis]